VFISQFGVGRAAAVLGAVQLGRPVDVVCLRSTAPRHYRQLDTERAAAARPAGDQSRTSAGLASAAVY